MSVPRRTPGERHHAPAPRAPRSRCTTLDRSLFAKTLSLAAATVQDNRNIARLRKQLTKGRELLEWERLNACKPDPVETGKKCLLLKEGVKADAPSTWGPLLQAAVEAQEVSVIPYELQLDYDYWSYLDVISSILPEDLHGEIPVGFNTAGHIAHLNLRDRYLPYKSIIAQVILDKNPKLRTVINKTDNVGTESEFRTFTYEVLAGPNDMDVEVKENDCTFQFDYSKVYWNSKLETEHSRLIRLFQPGEVVADVMAGIGPFAIPSGRKGVFVFANDMNPESYKCLDAAIARNKVGQYVRAFNQDGRAFIHASARLVREAAARGDEVVLHPKTHFVMNLPASATTFVHHFRGLYHGQEALFAPHTLAQLPLVHVHCFAVKQDDEVPLLDICDRIFHEIGVRFKPGDAANEGEMSIYNVRDVAPKKRMFCASFRIPPEVAFASETS
ncbi:tRNA (guanine-N(1)-)-methyltransferase [Verticillium alfalfae VaMs.102]|uniref:tRNA (guanine(37)-N1)-methyltransferase n=1 Tax=Verticillium alfalfae (strain VaMs.102 / ATCC MYA-4576 / FGSC 10136) TaxID=526221 RepID=C9SM09_VERA1|nr:tRNA (guanine-N(1)-)-methyltransferase [Verticillium alfalfae VaMs.102]EEY19824.1 tRNA (guanine-N(1)-)-methyltransferase [Verticillium alfalfae VaMs.102]